MTAMEWCMAIVLVVLALATLGMGIGCARLLEMIARLSQESARMRRRAIRAENRALLLTRAIEDYAVRVEQARISAAELDLAAK